MTHEQIELSQLTPRERRALQALLDKRALYVSSNHPVAAGVMGMALWLVWQVFHHVHVNDRLDDEAPPPAPPPSAGTPP